MQTGTVYLVGAGPGDPGLLTLKGKACLEKADIVIYDALANESLLNYLQPQAKRVYVGKKAGQHTMKQDDINALLVESARQYAHVVRLKGGDPFVFGRGGEEALVLAENQIPFEIVPGVTAGIAVPAYSGIPVTHRDTATSVAFVTGHESPDKTEEDAQVDWQRMARSCDTLVIYMGVKNLPYIVQELKTAGLPDDTPVAVICDGTYPAQRTLTGTLQTIASQAQEQNVKPPAMIVVGSVVKLHDSLSWFEQRPLFGQTIVVTRNADADARLTNLLEDQGAQVLHFPTIEIVEGIPNPDMEQAMQQLASYDWLIFTSGNAVRIFFQQLLTDNRDIRALHDLKIAAIGKPTAEQLQTYHLHADFVPDQFTSEQLVAGMLAQRIGTNTRILFPCSNLSNPHIAEQFRQAGATIDVLPVYETRLSTPEAKKVDELKSLIQHGQVSWITFTSSSTVHNFVQLVGQEFLAEYHERIPAASIGPVTTATLEEYGLRPRVTASKHTYQGLVNAMRGDE
ncbi:uroporphyrinogen III synthase/methyltransferase [Candidatus Vecturithrix granuli]|uniref:uroporphyrinogen-III C-methyltransferase n=1 Tax=Vecturithrix granuli TaxID=1499967 RepID=A0A081C6U5_VECG1|nr:uroporphyrinogen III synthase/methyltransferase [Candidatus Vecturithrix granuli]